MTKTPTAARDRGMEVREQMEPKQESQHSHVMSLRRGRASRIRIPVAADVTFVDVELRTEIMNGRPVVRYFLPEGAKVSHNQADQASTSG